MNMSERPSGTSEATRLIELLERLAEQLAPRQVTVMEVCGTHTVTAQAVGLHTLLPGNVRLISGPGCPVCVTPAGFIEQATQLALRQKVHVMTYGDMMRVGGITQSLEDARRHGGNVSVVYSARQALEAARDRPDEKVVFLGVGFETTTPAAAYALRAAEQEGISNFTVLSAHKRIVPAMEALLGDAEVKIDGFIAPGHVSVIIGAGAYEVLVERYGRPCVVAGFDGEQMLMALVAILTQLIAGEPKVDNVYRGRVSEQGNCDARRIIDEVFEPADSRWRGLGVIAESGLVIRPELADFDAQQVFGLAEPEDCEPAGCRCAEVLRGVAGPEDCELFGKGCTPATPVGACMVSREGACSAVYKYRKIGAKA